MGSRYDYSIPPLFVSNSNPMVIPKQNIKMSLINIQSYAKSCIFCICSDQTSRLHYANTCIGPTFAAVLLGNTKSAYLAKNVHTPSACLCAFRMQTSAFLGSCTSEYLLKSYYGSWMGFLAKG